MKIHNFRGELPDISAKREAPVQVAVCEADAEAVERSHRIGDVHSLQGEDAWR